MSTKAVAVAEEVSQREPAMQRRLALLVPAWFLFVALLFRLGTLPWFSSLVRRPLVFSSTVATVLACGLAFAARSWRVPRLDTAVPSRLLCAAAVGAVLLQAGSTVAFSRPDWDDCYYLAAVADFEAGGRLNAEEPSHREGLRVPAHQRLLTWELCGAMLCKLSGLDPRVAFHSVLPPLLVLLAYAAYAPLFRQCVPAPWAPVAILGLSAVHVFGVSSHEAAANFLLPRLWQGKAILVHLALPLVVTRLLELAAHVEWRRSAALVVATLFALSVSLSAISSSCRCSLASAASSPSPRRGRAPAS